MLARWKSPSQVVDRPSDFHYAPLKSSRMGIRLVELLPGSGGKAVYIRLIHSYISGSARIPYVALSYTWGESPRMKNISCNGKRLAVTQTLLEALQRFRHPIETVTLWIDQICICQDRIQERNQQVQMMGQIFKSADKVIVWLGEEYDDSRAGMQLAKQLLHISKHQKISGLRPGDLEAHGLPKQGHKRWKALSAILTRPWFWRTWIVQEVVLNPTVELVLGASMMTWDELESIVALLEGPIPSTWHLDESMSATELPFSRINRIRLRHRRKISSSSMSSTVESIMGAMELTDEPQALGFENDEGDPELLDLLLVSRGLGATDPRDKIYALLGLGKHDISPDYSMAPESVFTDFALQTIGLVTNQMWQHEQKGEHLPSTHLDVRRVMILLACAGKQNQKLKLSSWVPDWTVNLASRPLIFGVGQRFTAGGSELGHLDWQPDFGLQLDGILLDTIQAAGSVLLDHQNESSGVDSIPAWWTEATEIAHKRIALSPGSTGYADAFIAMRKRLYICKHGYYMGANRSRRRGSLLDGDEIWFDEKHSVTQTLTLGLTRGRVMFASTTGYLGLAPHGTREGDIVFVIRGADVPFVLRPCGEAYELIGEAYVQGVMNGEALEMGQLLLQNVMVR